MPWFRLDDSFHSHPKVIAAGNEAIGLYVRCGTYAAEHLTDGFIREDIAVLYGASDTGSRRNPGTGKPETLAETLVRTKLWRRARGGWRMPDYLDYNFSKEAVDKERKAAAERQRRRREALLSRRDSRRESTRESHDPDPTRPDPEVQPLSGTARHKPAGSPLAGTRSRGTRLPDNWTPARKLVEWARAECPSVDSRSQTDRFHDYWRAKTGANATKLDWDATWRNWIRKAAEQQTSRGRHSRQSETDELFDDALARARAKDAQENGNDPRGNDTAHPLRQSLLPPAGH